MIENIEEAKNSSEDNAGQQKHSLEQMPPFKEHMQQLNNNIDAAKEDSFDEKTDEEEWLNDFDEEIDEETRKNVESWGAHKFDEDFDPKIRLTDSDLLARDINSIKWKRNSFQQERAQELFERKLNEEMTDISELELLAENNVDNLSAEKIHYQDKEITIINVSGYPLKFLKSSINSPIIIKHPKLWAVNGEKYKSFRHVHGGGLDFDPTTGEASNTICTSYVDTDINPEMAVGGTLSYIFTHVKPDSVVDAGPGDIFSDTDAGSKKPTLLKDNKLNMPQNIAEKSKGFNEVTLRRYDESGNPLLPTAILIHDSMEVDENTLKSAAFFNIPIIHIYRQAYNK